MGGLDVACTKKVRGGDIHGSTFIATRANEPAALPTAYDSVTDFPVSVIAVGIVLAKCTHRSELGAQLIPKVWIGLVE